jgi:acetyl-CoA C-acetyltransferase
MLSKHALGLYSTNPPAGGFKWANPQAEVDALPHRVVCDDCDGNVTIESWTVMFDRDGSPETGIAACLLDDGRRAWGTTSDAESLKSMTTEEQIGRRAMLRPGGELRL